MGPSEELDYTVLALLIRCLPLRKKEQLEAWWFLHAQSENKSFDPYQLQQFNLGLDPASIEKAADKAKRLFESAQKNNIKAIVYGGENYPAEFHNLGNKAPLVLFAKGNSNLVNTNGVAVIGTRNPSKQGEVASEKASQYFTAQGQTIISGLASGCDTIAHQTCLNLGGKTIATLPCPINAIYPKENQNLADEIAQADGLLLSEYLSGERMKKHFFIERDIHQALLSQTLFLAESPLDGGAMHAMNYGYTKKRKLLTFKPKEDKLWTSDEFSGNRKVIEELGGQVLELG